MAPQQPPQPPQQNMAAVAETEQMFQAGIVDNETYQLDPADLKDQPAEAQQPQTAAQPQLREITIRVPIEVTDEMVQAAWACGQTVMSLVMQGMAVLFYPTQAKNQKGEVHPAVGRAIMPIRKPKDVNLLKELMRVIGNVNAKQDEAEKQPTKLLEATVRGETMKDEAARQATAMAEGNPLPIQRAR